MKQSAVKRARQHTARERIDTLFTQASVRQKYAKRYVSLARRMAQKYKVRIPDKWRRRFCKECNAFLVPGKNCRIRTRSGKVVIRCLECDAIRRIPVKR